MNRIWVASCFFAVCVMGVVFAFCKLRPEISYSLDFGSLVDALVLVFIGVLVEYAYSKQSSDKRADTDLLLGIVEEVKVAFHKLVEKSEFCESGKALTKAQETEITCAERELSNAVHSLEEALRYCKVKLDKLNFEQLKSARSELKDSLTDSPYPGPYDQGARIRIRTAKRVMRDELTRMAFAINRR